MWPLNRNPRQLGHDRDACSKRQLIGFTDGLIKEFDPPGKTNSQQNACCEAGLNEEEAGLGRELRILWRIDHFDALGCTEQAQTALRTGVAITPDIGLVHLLRQ